MKKTSHPRYKEDFERAKDTLLDDGWTTEIIQNWRGVEHWETVLTGKIAHAR